MNAYTIIKEHVCQLIRMNESCGERHDDAMGRVAHSRIPTEFFAGETHQKALSLMLQGLALYAEAHEKMFESKLADDGVLGEEWLEMAKGFLGLLNGELGHLDGGTLDGTIRDVAAQAGFEEEL